MVLSQTAEYALRAMGQLAVLPHDGAVRGKDLAELTDIPSDYLFKIMRMLVRGGLLKAERGHGGGFRLARAPAEIRFAEILDAVGALPEKNRCAFGWGQCNPKKPCLLHPVVSGLNEAVEQWAHSATRADIAAKPSALERYAEELAAVRAKSG